MSQVSDDERSSSLSDLEEGAEAEDVMAPVKQNDMMADADSEAETERIDESPQKKHRTLLGSIQRPDHADANQSGATSVIEDMEVEQFSDSAISSPAASDGASLSEDMSEPTEGGEEDHFYDTVAEKDPGGKKRKRATQSDDSAGEQGADEALPRKRVGSIKDPAAKILPREDDEGRSSATLSREGSGAPVEAPEDPDDLPASDEEEDAPDQPSIKIVGPDQKARKSRLRSEIQDAEDGETVLVGEANIEDQNGVAEASDLDEDADGDEAEDAEAAARSEEELAKKTAAMESLLALEKRFATLRDRLYDERIAGLNNELAQLSGPNPTHPELLRQVQLVQLYRDDKFEIEQKLLVFKIGALKRKSVAERSQIHSAYFQTVRDIRERHFERASEFFYRIQRDRFKTDDSTPNYTIPFPTRRSQQITQQTAYNKEVSVLSGVAKYVGFPAAPELTKARSSELDEDMEKMGISPILARASNPAHQSRITPGFASVAARPAAEEQFLEETPWANPQHPVHSQYLSRLNRPTLTQPQFSEPTITPAAQKLPFNMPAVVGSASTQPENPSAPASSMLNTPYAEEGVLHPSDPLPRGKQNGGASESTPGNMTRNDLHVMRKSGSISPSEARKTNVGFLAQTKYKGSSDTSLREHDQSPSDSRHATTITQGSSNVPSAVPRSDLDALHRSVSPITFNQHLRQNHLTTRNGVGGIGV